MTLHQSASMKIEVDFLLDKEKVNQRIFGSFKRKKKFDLAQ